MLEFVWFQDDCTKCSVSHVGSGEPGNIQGDCFFTQPSSVNFSFFIETCFIGFGTDYAADRHELAPFQAVSALVHRHNGKGSLTIIHFFNFTEGVSRSAMQSVSQLVIQSFSLLVTQSAKRSVSWSSSRLLSQLFSHTVSQLSSQSVNYPVSQSVSQRFS